MKKFALTVTILLNTVMYSQIVINEIYGGGGNTGSTLKNDYIVLKNIGNTVVSLNGATIQYAPATALFTQYHNLPSITLNPGQSYLIQEATGGGGTVNLPNPDFIATTVLNFDGSPNPSVGIGIAVTSGKIVLANNSTQVSSPTDSNVLDFVGYGTTANQYEGAGPAPSPTTTTAIKRLSGDTNNNMTDFAIGSANPINSTGNTLSTSNLNNDDTRFFIKNTVVKDIIIFGNKVEKVRIYTVSGEILKNISGPVNIVDITNLPKGPYIVSGVLENKILSQKIEKIQ